MLFEWLRRYIDHRTGVEGATKDKYRRFVDLDIAPSFGSTLPVDALTQDLDAAWVVHLEQEVGNGPKIIASKHGFLSAAVASAVR
ncbi:hypothetical protein ACL02S_16325 [Nocardia sp. 004]|uniref:hypothetical protein n=1 Tax=Nocardia sp. 004 TaxID=3385978 RepID=UPI00399F1224